MCFLRPGILAVVLLAVLAGCAPDLAARAPQLHVVDEHHQAWPIWERARSEGVTPAGATLVHFDAHEDLGEPEVTTRVTSAASAGLADTELTVDDVVVPALFTGTVSEFRWVTPTWLEEPAREAVRQVGSERGLGRVLRVGEELPDCPDRREFRTRVLPVGKLSHVPGPVILDIDLDFFACENPHADHRDVEIGREEYERRMAEGKVRFEGSSAEGNRITRSTVLFRERGAFTWPVRLDRVVSIGGEVSYVRGFMCMGEYRDAFPVHRPTEAELRDQVASFKVSLAAAKLTPALITISRSVRSGFVPARRASEIEGRVIAALEEIYGGLQVVR